jgi:class 3 adenylate cyclase
VSHLEVLWDEPRVNRFLTRLAAFSRLIVTDPRGLGLSDRPTEIPTLEERVDDLIAVLDAADSEHAALFANADTGPACIAAAASRPERVESLILCGTYAKGSWSDEYPWGWTDEEFDDFRRSIKDDWGTAESIKAVAPSMADDVAFLQWCATLMRLGASPRAVLVLAEMTRSVDVRPLLPKITVPTLVMHRIGDPTNKADQGRYLADRIPRATWVELPGDDFLLWAGDTDAIVDEVEEFLTGRRGGAEPSRIVATLMFTDVVGSTQRADAMGDRAWANLLEVHNARVRSELHRFGGREIDTAGDGFLASFDSPTSAIKCAQEIVTSMDEIGVGLRIGLHTGECDVVNSKLRGIAVHIGARVLAKAGAGEIIASQTVRDLVTGSGINFDDRGAHELKGVPGEWRLYAVT